MNMTKKNALGRGLGALIDGVEKEVLEKKVEANLDISVDSILFNPGLPLMYSHWKNWLYQ
jgi:hypothetical protein